MEKTVVALFDDIDTAQRALEALISDGFDRSDVSVVRTNENGDYAAGTTTDVTTADTSGAAAGAGIGAALGGLAGLVIGLGVLAIPGLGPVLAAGPLAMTLAGAGIGAAAGGLIGALTDVGIPEKEAGYFAEGIRRGGTLLTVRANEDRVSSATQILNRFSPVDIDERADQWKSAGWSGFDPKATPYETDATVTSGTYSGPSGTVAGMGATSITGSYSGAGGMPTSGSAATDDMRQGAHSAGYDAERSYDRTTDDMSRSFDRYDGDFRSDYDRSFGSSGYGYERYQPAYRYGYNLATENRTRGRDWNDIETDARRDWEMRHPGDAWDDFKDAVQHAWQHVREDVKDTLD